GLSKHERITEMRPEVNEQQAETGEPDGGQNQPPQKRPTFPLVSPDVFDKKCNHDNAAHRTRHGTGSREYRRAPPVLSSCEIRAPNCKGEKERLRIGRAIEQCEGEGTREPDRALRRCTICKK